MRKGLKKFISTFLVAGVCLANPGLLWAAEEMPSFDLNEIVVTALRTEKTDLDTPAAVSVYKLGDLKNTGTKNLVEALQFTEGITYYGMGPGGNSWGGMNSKIIFRGLERGTLVMLNGVPLNMEGKYNLEDIPLETIEKVEVIKGAGTTLYGSEASGGVINIITKKDLPAKKVLTYQKGNFGYDKKSINWQNGKIGLTYLEEKTGARDKFCDSKYDKTKKDDYSYGFSGANSKNLALAYKFNDKLNLNYSHGDKEYSYIKNYQKALIGNQVSSYDIDNNNFDLIYEDKEKKVKAVGFYHDKKQVYAVDYIDATKTDTKEDDKYSNSGLDLQKNWQLNEKNNLLFGFNYKEDTYKNFAAGLQKINGERKNYSFYLQNSYQVNDKMTIILGGREQLVRQDTKKNKEYNEFTPQLQTTYKINDYTSWYTNIGKAFRLPNLKDLYDRDVTPDDIVAGNSNLKPEEGWNYETGLKVIKDDYSFKVSFFKVNLDNQLAWKTEYKGTDKYYYPINKAKFTNQGMEMDYRHKLNSNWSYSLGGSLSNPKNKDEGEDWQRTFGRVQLTSGLQYNKAKFESALNLNYLGQRIDPDTSNGLPDVFNVNLNCAYKVNTDDKLTLSIDNLLDRENTINHKESKYYALPFNWRLAWEHQF